MIRIYNFVRCVRGGTAELRATGPKVEKQFARHRPQPPGRRTSVLVLRRPAQ